MFTDGGDQSLGAHGRVAWPAREQSLPAALADRRLDGRMAIAGAATEGG